MHCQISCINETLIIHEGLAIDSNKKIHRNVEQSVAIFIISIS